MSDTLCQREGATPTDEGDMIVDCTIHGEVARVRTGGTVNRVVAGEYEAIEAAWVGHVGGAR